MKNLEAFIKPFESHQNEVWKWNFKLLFYDNFLKCMGRKGLSNKIIWSSDFRDVFRTLANIFDGVFLQKYLTTFSL